MDCRKEKAWDINLVTILELIEWIEQNLHEDINIDVVSSKSGYSKWHLQRVFKSITGESLGTYIRTRKLACTAIALRHFDHSIIDIITAYNFGSQQSFTRAFNEHYKITPAKYRKAKSWMSADVLANAEIENQLSVCCPSLKKAFPLEASLLKMCQGNPVN